MTVDGEQSLQPHGPVNAAHGQDGGVAQSSDSLSYSPPREKAGGGMCRPRVNEGQNSD